MKKSVEEKFEEIVHAANERKDKKKLKVAELAVQLDLSRTQGYELVNGNLYNSKQKRNFSDQVINRLHKELVSTSKYVEIGSYEFLKNTTTKAKQRGRMFCVYGKAGIGKTTALSTISNTLEGVHYVLCDHLDDMGDFIRKIHKSFGLEKVSVSSYLSGKVSRRLMINEIAELVEEKAEKPLLILDDIHHLGVRNYQDLKILFDKTENMMGIMLVGTELLNTKLKKLAGYDEDWNKRYKPKSIMPEFVRRFKGNFFAITTTSELDLIKISLHKGVEKREATRIARYYIKLPNLELGMFTEKLDQAIEVAKQSNMPVTLELMKSL